MSYPVFQTRDAWVSALIAYLVRLRELPSCSPEEYQEVTGSIIKAREAQKSGNIRALDRVAEKHGYFDFASHYWPLVRARDGKES